MTKEDLVALPDTIRRHNRTADGRTEFTPDHQDTGVSRVYTYSFSLGFGLVTLQETAGNVRTCTDCSAC